MNRRSPEKHIPSLDGIRALSALLVFLGHAGLGQVIPGGFGVTVFFVLSGYLITTLLRVEFEQRGHISLRAFYLRRVYRILPPLYLTLVVAALLPLPHATSTPTVGGVTAQVLQWTNYYSIFFGEEHLLPYTGTMWSLAIEEHFYILYPLTLAWCLRKAGRTGTARILLIACAFVLAWRCILVFDAAVGAAYTYFATDTRVDSLLFGCVLALVANPVLDECRWAARRGLGTVVIIAAGVVLMATFLVRGIAFRETFRYTLQSMALLPLFFASVRYSRSALFRWLEWAPVRGLGVISYTFYLIHMLALAVALDWFPQGSLVLRGLVGLALAIAYATLSYFLIERRLGDLRRRLHR